MTVTLTIKAADGATTSIIKADPVINTTTPPPPSAIPMTWNDARFASNKAAPNSGTGYHPTGSLNNLDWNFNPSYSSGDQPFTWEGGTLSLSKCRVDCREGPRIAADSGTFNIDQCYINCVGKATDHADAFQAYNPGGKGSVNITNTCIRSYSDQAAKTKYGSGFVGSTAFFWADNYQGAVTFKNVLLIGGSRTVSIYVDSGTTHVNFENVYFVPDPGQVWQTDIRSTGGSLVVDNWTNVRNATIVNGVIVPGTAVPHP